MLPSSIFGSRGIDIGARRLAKVNAAATPHPMRIIPYTDALAPAFHDINAAWISDMFVLEPHDEHVLSHPREAIINKGGTILFAEHPEHGIIGTGALMPTAPGYYELTKMGVLAAARGTGAGGALLAALVERASGLPDLDTLSPAVAAPLRSACMKRPASFTMRRSWPASAVIMPVAT